ncbi:AT-rich interactive domain-containing protein 1-like [Amaranthus tricolor]|uniref:AT-rich interactive domain-containing protein 1-like n=1 Tax=Amaranthus tricolor TaxID=29722 RepID=UPI002582B661|nr:AT-rich interactive domain-containing protein 1-like [Amaranthus tricolor]XP_057535548.1 AT-rich interactive domain-containing protein 1-like [Amaranthus tricolor]
MQKTKKKCPQSSQEDWLEYLDACLPALVIPIGSRFQVNVPEWKGAPNETRVNGDSDTSKWSGTRIWPLENENKDSEFEIGKGRPSFCGCFSPGTPICVKLHISKAKTKLQAELGPAFESWKFNEMGEYVERSWSSKQKKRFDSLVKANPVSKNKSFLQPAMSAFPSKTRMDIANYYLNVYIPRRIGMLTRSGRKVLDSDDEEVGNAENSLKITVHDSDDSTKLVKPHYLTGRR